MIHRKIEKWEWYDDANTFKVFIHLLLRANHAPKKWRGMTIDRGQLVTGRKKLSAQCNLSEQQIRTCLNRLKSTNEITIKATNKYSVITLNKYSDYQDKKPLSNQQKLRLNNQQANQQSTTNNKDNNKTNKGRFTPPSAQEVQEYLNEKGIHQFTGEDFVNHYASVDWYRGKSKIKSWKHCVGTWTKDKKNGSQESYGQGGI